MREGSSTCSTRPSRITAMRCDSASASGCAWVTKMKVMPTSRCRLISSISICSRSFASSAPSGFVQQQQARAVHQRARQRHALLLAAGELVREAAALSSRCTSASACFTFAWISSGGFFAIFSGNATLRATRHVREQRVALEHGVHRTLFRRLVGEVLAVEPDAARVGRIEAGDHAQQRGLAAAGGAEQREEFARLDRRA